MCLGSSLRKEYLGLHSDAERSRSQSQLIMTPMTPPCPEVDTEMGQDGLTGDFQQPWGPTEVAHGVHILGTLGSSGQLTGEGGLLSALLPRHKGCQQPTVTRSQ